MEHVFASECRPLVPNQYVLVHVAARRARQLGHGAEPRVPVDGVRSTPLVALREIASHAFTDSEIEALIAPPAQPAEDEPPMLERMSADETQLLDGMALDAAEGFARDDE
jgi:DNA-directed RNA polymerase omega subunit